MHSARPAATTVVTRPCSSSPGSTRYQAVSAMSLHPHPSLTQELDRRSSGITRGLELRAPERGALEVRVVEEAVDAPGPWGGIEVRLVHMSVAGRRAIGRPAGTRAVAGVDGCVE